MTSKWATIVKAKANYQCQVCGSTELLQAHDPTGEHTDFRVGVCLCALHHSEKHPDVPKALFFNKNCQPYWNNMSASSLAKKLDVCPRTIIRRAKALHIQQGVLSIRDKNRLALPLPYAMQPQRHIIGNSVVYTLRISKELGNRIVVLAINSLIPKNEWVVKCLKQKAPIPTNYIPTNYIIPTKMKIHLTRHKSNGQGTVFLPIRLPIDLDDRIFELSCKNLITKSAWVIKALEQKAFRGVK